MPPEEPTIHHDPVEPGAVQTHDTLAYEPIDEQDEWLEEPVELPRRPRRRLLGKGANPVFLSLIAVLLVACGFIGGVLIEKGENSAGSSTGASAGLASRFAALRGGAGGATGARSSATTAGATGAAGAAAGGGGFTRPTSGTVAYLAGSTLYVTNSEGNTVKVTTSAGTSVNKTVKSSVKGIHPGETVTITGATAKGGSVSAEAISVGSAGGGLTGLFGSAGGGAKSSGTAGAGAASLFGNG
jgi:hypothetical protein